LILLTVVSGIAAADADVQGPVAKRGWWWYQKEPVKQKEKKKEEEKAPTAAPVPELKNYTMKDLWEMPPSKFRPLMKALLDKAIQDPTASNVRDYYVVLDIARRKSLAFTNVAAYVWQKYPRLSTGKDYPVAAPGRNAMFSEQYSDVERTIEAARDDFALLYFYSPT
jgi:conjugal transfer pilus assembly protein TraF